MFGLSTASGAVTPASFSTLTRKSRVPPCTSSGGAAALLDPDPALGADVHGRQHAAIEHALQRGDRRRLVADADRVVERLHVGGGERLPEIAQRGLETPRLLRERLERDGLLGGALLGAEQRDDFEQDAAHEDNGGTRERVHHAGGCTTDVRSAEL